VTVQGYLQVIDPHILVCWLLLAVLLARVFFCWDGNIPSRLKISYVSPTG